MDGTDVDPFDRSHGPPAESSSHEGIYRLAHCYDLAFAYRDVPAECDTLARLDARHRRHETPTPAVLELAAGPARHARESARRGAAAVALDVSPAMCAFAREQAASDGIVLDTVCADMRDFALPRPCTFAMLLLDSASYLLDNDDMLRHLRCVARHLVDGGVYVLELSHPRDAFGVGRSTTTRWSADDGSGLHVDIEWGRAGDAFDPVTQIDDVTVTLQWRGPDGDGLQVERARQRRYTANEIDALVRAGGDFEIVEWLGSLVPPRAFDNDPASWRMIPVLRKRATRAPAT